jgi:hypothetical protein
MVGRLQNQDRPWDGKSRRREPAQGFWPPKEGPQVPLMRIVRFLRTHPPAQSWDSAISTAVRAAASGRPKDELGDIVGEEILARGTGTGNC